MYQNFKWIIKKKLQLILKLHNFQYVKRPLYRAKKYSIWLPSENKEKNNKDLVHKNIHGTWNSQTIEGKLIQAYIHKMLDRTSKKPTSRTYDWSKNGRLKSHNIIRLLLKRFNLNSFAKEGSDDKHSTQQSPKKGFIFLSFLAFIKNKKTQEQKRRHSAKNDIQLWNNVLG